MKKIVYYLAGLSFIGFLLSSCKPTVINFNPSEWNEDYAKRLIKKAQGIHRAADDPRHDRLEAEDTVFQTHEFFISQLRDRFITRDGIAEETVVSSSLPNPSPGLVKEANTYKLLVYVSNNEASRAAILMPTIFNADGECIGLGPAWLGTWGAGQMIFYKQLHWNPKKATNFKWEYRFKDNKYHRTKSIFTDNHQRETKNEIIVMINTQSNVITLTEFNISKIYNAAKNRMGGNKPVLFDISEIFGSPDALHFTRITNQ